MIRRVRNLLHRADPFSVREISQRLGICIATVCNIIHRDSIGVMRYKRKTHMLSNEQVEQRRVKIPRLLKHIGGEKWPYVISINEAFTAGI